MNTEEPKQEKKHTKHPLVRLLLVAGAAFGFFYNMAPDKRKRFTDRASGFLKQSGRTLTEYFIPHERNNYQPRVFHHHSVRSILLLVVLVKVGVVTTLFVLYPNLARLDQDVRSSMYTLINQYRVEGGGQPLKTNAYLESAASDKGRDMLANNYFSHFGLDGKKPWEWLVPSQYAFKAMGENLAMDFLTSGAVFKAFQNSPTHDKNLLNSAYTEIGIAVLNGYLDGHDTNLMVVFFASPKASPTTAVAQTAPVQPVTTVQPKPATPTTTTPVAPKLAVPVTAAPVLITQTPTTTPTSTIAVAEPRFVIKPLSSGGITEVLGESTDSRYVYAENLVSGSVFSQGELVQKIVAWSDRFFAAFLIAAVLLLIINIVVKIRIQHAPVIANALLLIVVLSIALYAHIHTVEAVSEQIRVLGIFL